MAGDSSRRYRLERKRRAVRMVAEIGAEHESEWAAMSRVAELLGVGSAEAVRKWVRRAEVARTSRADHPRPQLTRHSQAQQVATKINYRARRGGFGLRHPLLAPAHGEGRAERPGPERATRMLHTAGSEPR